MSKKKFSVIVADPPWSFSDHLKMSDVARGSAANYDTMTISDIKGLPINDFVSSKGTILALWVPSSLLQEGLDTMKVWGFKHKQTYVWVKTKKEPFKDALKGVFKHFSKLKSWSWTISGTFLKKNLDNLSLQNALAFGMGRLFRQTHEICLIGTSDNGIYKSLQNKSQRSVSFGENLKHSAKPEHLQDSLDIMFPRGNKLELFARRHRPGWICLGNEICNGEDIRVSLAKL
jgi:N6-adenosine-specific RNA methylase IME4